MLPPRVPVLQLIALYNVVFFSIKSTEAIDLESPRLSHDASILAAEVLDDLQRSSIEAAASSSAALAGVATATSGLMRREAYGGISLAAVGGSADGSSSVRAWHPHQNHAAAPKKTAAASSHSVRVPSALAPSASTRAKKDAGSNSTIEYEMVTDCESCGECAWGGADTQGDFTGSLAGSGHTQDDCKAACMARSTCHYAALSTSGYCHMFEVCSDPTPEGDKTRWLKQAKVSAVDQVMVLDCDACGECPWSAADHEGQASLGGNNHSAEDCKAACLASEGCQVAARSPSGYCHMFNSCNQAAPEGDKTRWKKHASSMGLHKADGAQPKRSPDSWAMQGAKKNNGLPGGAESNNSTLMLDTKAQAEFTMDEMSKIGRRAGVDIAGQSAEQKPSANPLDTDVDTKEETLALYGIAAICVLFCSACVYYRSHSEQEKAEKDFYPVLRANDSLISERQ